MFSTDAYDIKYSTPSINAHLLEEKSRRISSQSDLKWWSLGLFWSSEYRKLKTSNTLSGLAGIWRTVLHTHKWTLGGHHCRHLESIMCRVRTILVLAWVLGNIHRYWTVLLLGDIFCCSDTQYNTNQTAFSTAHMSVNDYSVPLLTCTLTDAIIFLDTMLICCSNPNHDMW